MSTKSAVVLVTSALFLLSAVACDNGKSAAKRLPPGATATPANVGDPADVLYGDRCSGCHGSAGKGDGTLAGSLAVKPRDFSDASWQTAATDEKIRTAILKGGKAIGGSELMPASPDLEKRTDVLDALVKKVRGFKK
ncbi:MAG: hypothetical protein U0174_19640 [Polyangiaceae bacterium]